MRSGSCVNMCLHFVLHFRLSGVPAAGAMNLQYNARAALNAFRPGWVVWKQCCGYDTGILGIVTEYFPVAIWSIYTGVFFRLWLYGASEVMFVLMWSIYAITDQRKSDSVRIRLFCRRKRRIRTVARYCFVISALGRNDTCILGEWNVSRFVSWNMFTGRKHWSNLLIHRQICVQHCYL